MAPPNTRHGSTAARRPGAYRKAPAERQVRAVANPAARTPFGTIRPICSPSVCKERIWRSWA